MEESEHSVLIVDDPHEARETQDPEAVRQWYTEFLNYRERPDDYPGPLVDVTSPQRLVEGSPFGAMTCEMMISSAHDSPDERCCGVAPTVGGNWLYRYCEQHARQMEAAGSTTFVRDVVAKDPSPGAKKGQRSECPMCFTELTPINTWHHTVHFPGSVKTIVTCAGERCVAWANRVQDDAKAMRERAMVLDTSSAPIGKTPPPESLPALRARLADSIRRGDHGRPLLLDGNPPPRPDGFSQSKIDEIKATMLATSPKAVKQ